MAQAASETGSKRGQRRGTKTATGAPPNRYQQRLGRLLREAVLFASAAMTTFLLAALLTYDRTDPGWSGVGSGAAVHNMFGTPGAWFADVLFSLFGWLAFIFPWLVLYGGWLVFASIRHGSASPLSRGIRGVSLLLWLLSGCGLTWLVLGDAGTLPQGSGGILGMATGDGLGRIINPLGAAWLLFTIFIITLSTGLGFSWLWVTERIGHFVLSGASNGLQRLLAEYRVRRDARAEKAAAAAAQDDTDRRNVQVHNDGAAQRKPRKRRAARGRGQQRVEPTLAATGAEDDRVVAEQPARAWKAATQLDLPMAETGSSAAQAAAVEALAPLPPTNLLDPAPALPRSKEEDDSLLQKMAADLEQHLADFNVGAKVTAVHPGPVITRFELDPAPGVKVNQISNLAKDLARAMSTTSVRVVEVIPGKPVVGLEIPNSKREIVALREIVESERYADSTSSLTMALGKDIGGTPVVADLGKMPHLLVAGTTGSGKSVAINAMIVSILQKAEPAQVRLILIDPKMLELSVYEGIPHLLAPVVTDMKQAANALRWCVGEMERRYKLMAALGVRNMKGFNRKVQQAIDAGAPLPDPLQQQAQSNDAAAAGEEVPTLEPLPAIVIVIDELADLMMVVGKKVEELIARLAQKARAAGLHMILATQRPSVDVITGLIKANIPTRIAFQVASRVDSRTILDQQGAESLLGHGDMLYLPPGTGFSTRVHGAFVDDHEVHKVVEYLKQIAAPEYIDEILEGGTADAGGAAADDEDSAEDDPLYDQAVAIVTKTRKASISYVQRRLRVGYNRAARLIEQMENAGLVGPSESGGKREVLAPPPPPDD